MAQSRMLIVFHTSEGQTAKIAERIASVLRERGDVVDVSEVEGAPAPDAYDGVIVGDSIHAVKHSRVLIRAHVRVSRDHYRRRLAHQVRTVLATWTSGHRTHLPRHGPDDQTQCRTTRPITLGPQTNARTRTAPGSVTAHHPTNGGPVFDHGAI